MKPILSLSYRKKKRKMNTIFAIINNSNNPNNNNNNNPNSNNTKRNQLNNNKKNNRPNNRNNSNFNNPKNSTKRKCFKTGVVANAWKPFLKLENRAFAKCQKQSENFNFLPLGAIFADARDAIPEICVKKKKNSNNSSNNLNSTDEAIREVIQEAWAIGESTRIGEHHPIVGAGAEGEADTMNDQDREAIEGVRKDVTGQILIRVHHITVIITTTILTNKSNKSSIS